MTSKYLFETGGEKSSQKPQKKLSFNHHLHNSALCPTPPPPRLLLQIWPLEAAPPSATTTEMQVEFLCPISRSLMADPVIVPSGHTFERSCIQACAELAFTPPSLAAYLDLSSAAAQLVLIPNNALRSAIVGWCQRCGLPPPAPMPREAAIALVRCLMSAPSVGPPPSEVLVSHAYSGIESGGKDDDFRAPHGYSGIGYDAKDEAYSGRHESRNRTPDVEDEKGETFRATVSLRSKGLSPFSMRTKKISSLPGITSTSSSTYYSMSSSEIVTAGEPLKQEKLRAATLPPNSKISPPLPSSGDANDLFEEDILTKLKNMEISDQESAATALRQATRESPERRKVLCTPRILAAFRPMLLSRSSNVQINAAAAMVNLSLEAANKVRIVRSGAVPPLVDVLKGGHPEAREHAAGALYSLALEEENRAAIGVLGAIPPLLDLFARPAVDEPRARRDAGMAIYHLSLANSNRSKIARTAGAIRALLAVAAEREDAPSVPQQSPSLARLAMMVVCNLAGCQEGRAALMDGGAVASVVALMKRSTVAGVDEDYCVGTLYGMSRGSLRFRGLARAAGADRVLTKVAEGGSGGRGGEVRKEMARKTLRTMMGEDDEDESAQQALLGFSTDGDGSIVSEGLGSYPRRYKEYGSVSGLKSAGF